eukprot:GSChrysophyteH1.ASY1.ANO1.96.1 assembled CDS
MRVFLSTLRGSTDVYEMSYSCSVDELRCAVKEREQWPPEFNGFHLVMNDGKWIQGSGDTKLTSWWGEADEVNVQIRLSIVGGKGGFGALLRLNARQKGEKTTTNFGACRDLSGRRLRHVNDEIILKKWSQAVEDGVKYDPSDTTSGINNWFLGTPSWADIRSAKRTQRNQNFQNKRSRIQEKTNSSNSNNNEDLKSVNDYLRGVESAYYDDSKVHEMVRQGLKKRKRENTNEGAPLPQAKSDKSKDIRVDGEDVTENECPLVQVSGALLIRKDDHSECSYSITGQGIFSTAVLGGCCLYPNAPNTHPSRSGEKSHGLRETWYYDVVVKTLGSIQIGWAHSLFLSPEAGATKGIVDGVGDDCYSWAWDGLKCLALHDDSVAFPTEKPWQIGDVVRCMLHVNTDGTVSISYERNGAACGEAFVGIVPNELSNTYVSLTHSASQTSSDRDTTGNGSGAFQGVPACGFFPAFSLEEGEEILVSLCDGCVGHRTSEDEADESIGTSSDKSEKGSANAHYEKLTPHLVNAAESAAELESYGLNELKSALEARSVKSGGTLSERAVRLFAVRGLEFDDIPKKLRAKK